MYNREFKAEIVLESDEDLNNEQREELLREIAHEAGIEDGVEFGSPVRRHSIEEGVILSIGTVLVNNPDTLIRLYEYLKARIDCETGIVKTTDGQLVDSANVDETFIENNGGIVIGNIEGDVVFQEDPDADPMELSVALNKVREEGEEED
jgi:hypothetical protein